MRGILSKALADAGVFLHLRCGDAIRFRCGVGRRRQREDLLLHRRVLVPIHGLEIIMAALPS